MSTVMTRYGLSAFALISAMALSACSGPASLSPTSPSSVAASAAMSASIGDKISATGDPTNPCLAVSPAGEGEQPPPCEPPPPPPCESSIGTMGDEPVPCEPPPPPPGDEGCTPGYWKNHTDSWRGYSTSTTLTSVFGANALAGTLLDGLGFGGGAGVVGAKRILLRAASAALLNAAHSNVNYPPQDVIALVTSALNVGSRDAMLSLASSLDNDNNLGCPLN
jgi:hypothetical protein